MVDQSIVPALREALKQNEIGDASPYVLSYAKKGASGASFGIFQGDTNVDDDARRTLRAVLEAAGLEQETCDRIVDAVSRPLPNGSPLSKADQRLVDKALSSDAGKPLVDAMDQRIFAVIANELDSSLDAAREGKLSIDPTAQLSIALWVNMTGAPTTLNKWLRGEAIGELPPPSGPVVEQDDMLRYLAKTQYFTLHPRNLKHFEASVASGAKLLPTDIAAAEPAVASDGAADGSTSAVVSSIFDNASGEWNFFGNQTYDSHGHPTRIGHKEGDEGYYQRVGEYWTVGTNTHGLDGRDHSWPWSAAFISWVMRESGAGERFRYSTQHSVYIAQSIRDLNNRPEAGYWGWRLQERKPALGDLVCWSRQAGIDYDHQNGGDYKGHCDIVVEVQHSSIFVIGGNVGDSVTRRPLPLNAHGYLLPTQQGGETLFAIMGNRFT